MHKLGLQRYLTTGVLLVVPLWLTYVIAKLVFTTLAGVTEPVLRLLDWPDWVRQLVGGVLTILLIYLVGWLGSRVLGRQLINLMDRVLDRIPLVQTIYGGIRKLLDVMQTSPGGSQRVVLVERPGDGVKVIGLLTRVLTDTETGAEYAVVYLPSTPNPTSGTLELVDLDRVHATDISMDQATRFVVSGGTLSPDRFAEKVFAGPAT